MSQSFIKQPDNSYALLVSPVEGGADQDVNLVGINGVAPSIGNGATDTGTQRVTISNDSTGQVTLAAGTAAVGTVTAVGNVASGAADSGEPVKVGAKYNGTRPTFTTGQRGDLQIGSRGSLGVTLYAENTPTPVQVTSAPDAGTGTGSLQTTAYIYGLNGTTFDRIRSYPGNVDGVTPPTLGLLGTASYSYVFDGTNFGRMYTSAQGTNSTGARLTGVGIGAQFDDVSPTAISENNFGNVRMTANHAVLVKSYASDAETWRYAAASGGIVNTTGITIQAAPAGSLRNYVTGCDIANSGALGTDVQIRDGASGTVMWRGYVGAVGAGNASQFIPFDPPLRGTAATLTEVALGSGTTVAVYFNARGYTAL